MDAKNTPNSRLGENVKVRDVVQTFERPGYQDILVEEFKSREASISGSRRGVLNHHPLDASERGKVLHILKTYRKD